MDLTAITLTELRYLVAVGETGHFGRAASLCHVSQPTLSTQIVKLEGTLGVRLFERTTKRVQPTAVGARILEHARVVLEEIRTIGDVAHGHTDPLTGPLRLGVIPTLGPYVLPWLVPALQTEFPRLRLVLRENLTAALLDDLTHARLDAALLALPVTAPGVASEPLFDEPFWLLVPGNHRFAAERKLRKGDLCGERVLLLTEGHCLRDQALAICDQVGSPRDEDDFRATSLETLRHMVAAGLGCTLLPALAVESLGGAATVAARAFRPPTPSRRIGLAWRRSFPHGETLRVLADFIRSRVPRGVVPVAPTTNEGGRPRRPAGPRKRTPPAAS